jgi:hypothetical protein
MELVACWSGGVGTVPGRSSIHCWDGPKRRVVRYSFRPMLAVRAFLRKSSATSVLRQMPVIPGLGISFVSSFTLYFAEAGF